MSTNPFEQPLSSEQAQATAPAGNPFDAPLTSEQQPPQQDQPGFLQRAYETSPLPGIWDAAKGTFHQLADDTQKQADAIHGVVSSLNAGDMRGAANHAMTLLWGDNPFQDVAKNVVKNYVNDAQQNYNAAKSGDVSAIPVVGPGAAKYIEDVKAGNTSGAIGDVVGTAASIAPALLGDEGVAAKAGDAVDAVKSTAGKAKALVSEDAAAATAQPAVQDAIRSAAERENTITRAKEGAAPEAPPSIRDSIQDVADEIKARSKAAFQTLDDASGGRWQRFDDQLSNLRDKMDEVSGIDDEAYSKYEQRAIDVAAAQNDLVNSLVHDGKIDPDLAEQAKNDYRQSSALYDVSQQIRSSASGLRPEIGEGTPETVDPAKLSPRLNKLYDSGRLQQALGNDGAAKLVQQVDEAQRTKASAIKTTKLVKTIGKAAGIGIGLSGAGALYEGAKHVLGGK
jgi:hypothetical protein